MTAPTLVFLLGDGAIPESDMEAFVDAARERVGMHSFVYGERRDVKLAGVMESAPDDIAPTGTVVIAVAVDNNGSVGAMLTHTSEIEEAKLIAWFDTIPALFSGYRDEL